MMMKEREWGRKREREREGGRKRERVERATQSEIQIKLSKESFQKKLSPDKHLLIRAGQFGFAVLWCSFFKNRFLSP